MSKLCLNCDELFNGRIDKKFCTDTCRNCYNNKLKISASEVVRETNSTLRKNRRILEELIPLQTSIVSKKKLLQKGFNFGYHTSIYKTRKGAHYFFCYEYGYHQVQKGKYTIVKRKDENNA